MISQEFAYAKAQGWLPYFVGAASAYSFDPSLLMAIASRETNMRNEVGDRGHGYGIMQVDVGTNPDFCHSGAWRNVSLAIHTGAGILASKRDQLQHLIGAALQIGGYRFVGAELSATDMLHVTVAAYNAGLWAYWGFSVHGNPDDMTTGHDYSKDVIERRNQFAELLK